MPRGLGEPSIWECRLDREVSSRWAQPEPHRIQHHAVSREAISPGGISLLGIRHLVACRQLVPLRSRHLRTSLVRPRRMRTGEASRTRKLSKTRGSLANGFHTKLRLSK